MTETEHILTCLSEECGEVIQAASKALRFGLNNKNPKTGVINKDHLIAEITDVVAVINILVERGILDDDKIMNENALEAKAKKLNNYLIYAKDVGAIHD